MNEEIAGSIVLVTGGTGFTGGAVLRKLSAAGARIRCLIRESSSTANGEGLDVEWLTGDLTDASFVTEAMKGVRYVIHMASSYRDTYVTEQEEFDLHVAGTRNLAQAALAQPDFCRFVHVSSVGVHGHIEDPPADEEYRFAPGDSYQRTKLEAEKWIYNYGQEKGLPVTVVRPAAIYGPGDKRLLKLFKLATMPLVPLIGNGRCLYHLIHVEDLADFLLLCAVHPDAAGHIFICGNEKPISLHDIIRVAGDCYGVKNRFVRIPEMPVKTLSIIMDRIFSPLRIKPPLHPRRVAFFTKDRAFDTSKMRNMLGFHTTWQNEDGIQSTARWYSDHGWVRIRG